MKANIPNYNLTQAKTLNEALNRLDKELELNVFAGGTDLMVLFEAGKLKAGNYLDISPLDALKKIKVTKSHIDVGALVTFSEILNHPVLKKEFPLLCHAALMTGARAIQNRGTLGGNIVNASPAADSPPALLVYNTTLILASKEGEREIPYEAFHEGYKKTKIASNELLKRIIIKRDTKKLTQYYRKVGTRKAQAISKICIASTFTKTKKSLTGFKLAFASVAPIPLRCKKTEDFVLEAPLTKERISNAMHVLAQEITPINDIRSNKFYRLKVSQNLLRELLESI